MQMQWTVGQLQKFTDDDLIVDEKIKLDKNFEKRNPEILGSSLIHVKGRAIVQPNRATFYLHISGTLILPCSRTLVETDYPVDIHTTEIFTLRPMEYDLGNDEEIVHEPEGGMVNLIPIIEELLLLEVPIQVISETALKSENLPHGKDWSLMTEDEFIEEQQQKKKVDPRLAGLADFFKDNQS